MSETNKIVLKFRGDKNCTGVKCGKFFIGGMRAGTVYDVNGIVFGRYNRVTTDGGRFGDFQHIDFWIDLGEDDADKG